MLMYFLESSVSVKPTSTAPGELLPGATVAGGTTLTPEPRADSQDGAERPQPARLSVANMMSGMKYPWPPAPPQRRRQRRPSRSPSSLKISLGMWDEGWKP